jgi:hypothetical protein
MPGIVVNVPNLPGVPSLNFNFSILPPTLLTSDALNAGSLFQNRWGVFNSSGQGVIIFDTFLSIDFRKGWVLADFPLEQGAFQSYDKVQTPFDVRVKFASGGTLTNREQLLQSVDHIAGDLNLYTVVTPEAVYNSVNVQHYDYRRTNTNGNGLITVEMWLLEIRSASGGQASTQNSQTANPVAANQTTTSLDQTQFFTNGAPPLTNTFAPNGTTIIDTGSVQGIPITSPNQQFNTLPSGLS